MIGKKSPKKGVIARTTLKQSGSERGSQKSSKVDLASYLEEVKKRAYELFQERGSAHGSDLEDWLRAEREIKQRYGIR